MPRSTARGGRALGLNNLDGTLPAELGNLTDLEGLCAALRRCCPRSPSAGPVGGALTRLRWCTADVKITSSAARSAAGSARWRSSPTCTRRSAPGLGCLDVPALRRGYSKQRMIRCGCRTEPTPLPPQPPSPPPPATPSAPHVLIGLALAWSQLRYYRGTAVPCGLGTLNWTGPHHGAPTQHRGALAGAWRRITWTARCRRSSASSRTSRLCAPPCAAVAAQPIGGTGRRRSHAPSVVRSNCYENTFSGTIGSWIGSMARLTYL